MKTKYIRFKESGKYYSEEQMDLPDNTMPWRLREEPDIQREMAHGYNLVFPDGDNPWGFPHLLLQQYLLDRAVQERRDQAPLSDKALELVRDLAEHGLRYDLNPTQYMGPDANRSREWWADYFSRADRGIRERAKAALRKRGCKLDTDGDGNCPLHPRGCP